MAGRQRSAARKADLRRTVATSSSRCAIGFEMNTLHLVFQNDVDDARHSIGGILRL
jgi:hypothetical protein